MKIICVIPARYQSVRFEGKPLALIKGKPMIWWSYNTMSKMSEIAETFVATDDKRIFDAVESFGGQAIMTGQCACGTDRVAAACQNLQFDVVINIQGDEPLIHPELVRDLIWAFGDPEVKMASLRKRALSLQEIEDPNIVKVIVDKNDDAIYFSRYPIPYNRDNTYNVNYYKHIGVYGYTKDFLYTYTAIPRSPLESAENLEQLRVLENGFKIRVPETKYQSIGVDLPEHIALVEREMDNDQHII